MESIFFYGTTYIIPNMDTVVCGGTAQVNDWNTEPSDIDTKIIMDDIIECFPAMKDATVVRLYTFFFLLFLFFFFFFFLLFRPFIFYI